MKLFANLIDLIPNLKPFNVLSQFDGTQTNQLCCSGADAPLRFFNCVKHSRLFTWLKKIIPIMVRINLKNFNERVNEDGLPVVRKAEFGFCND